MNKLNLLNWSIRLIESIFFIFLNFSIIYSIELNKWIRLFELIKLKIIDLIDSITGPVLKNLIPAMFHFQQWSGPVRLCVEHGGSLWCALGCGLSGALTLAKEHGFIRITVEPDNYALVAKFDSCTVVLFVVESNHWGSS